MKVDLTNKSRPSFGSRLCHGGIGFLAAAYIIVGRWSPSRLVGSEDSLLIVEPRLWLVVGLLILALVPVNDPRKVALPKSRRLPIGRTTLLMSSLLVYLLLTALWAPEAGPALLKAYEVLLTMTAMLSMYRLLLKLDPSAIASAFWQWILILTGLLALAAVPSAGAGGRLAVLAGGPNVFGRLMALLYVAAISRLVGSKRLLGWSLVVVGAGVLVLLSGSRGAMIAVAVASVFFFFVHRARFGKMVVIGIICFSVGMFVFMFTPMGMLMTDAFQARIGALMVDRVYTSGRDVIYAEAVQLIQAHPVGGVGLGGFFAITGWSYPHNIFLELQCEGGLLATGLFIAAIAAFCFAMVKHRARLDVTSLTALIVIFVASQFGGDLYDSRSLFLFPLFVLFADDSATNLLRRKAHGSSEAAVYEGAGTLDTTERPSS